MQTRYLLPRDRELLLRDLEFRSNYHGMQPKEWFATLRGTLLATRADRRLDPARLPDEGGGPGGVRTRALRG